MLEKSFCSYIKDEMDKWQKDQIDRFGIPAFHFAAFRKAFDEEMQQIAHIFDSAEPDDNPVDPSIDISDPISQEQIKILKGKFAVRQ